MSLTMNRFRRWAMAAMALIAVLSLLRLPFGQIASSTMFRFEIANNRLLAIESGGSYGTESAVYTTDDDGDTWYRIESPPGTLSLGGNGADLLALTSDNQVWRRSGSETSWNLISSLPGTHHYSILVDRSGQFLVSGINELTWHAADGQIVRRITAKSPQHGHVLFVSAIFVSDDEERAIVEANPFSIFLLDIRNGELTPWKDGLALTPQDLGGVGRIRRFGDKFLFSSHDGIYESNGANEPWTCFIKFRRTGELDDEFCRDLVSHNDRQQEWLLATNPGIRLFRSNRSVRTVFTDTTTNHANGDDHDLIVQIVPFHGNYFVSFARLKNHAVGVRLSADLVDWKTMRSTPQ